MEILRYAAFSDDPDGGNPAGVVLDATGAGDAEMLAVAADLGYSESAAYAERHGPGIMHLTTRAGVVDLSTHVLDGVTTATLVSVEPTSKALDVDLRAELLAALDWTEADLDPEFPLRVAYAGAWHPIVAAGSRARLAALTYDFDALGALMAGQDWTTIDLLWRQDATTFHARNPFPPGGVVEDPATGAAAAAFGGYLREQHLVEAPASITVHQGDDLGRPSLITVDIPAAGGISVTGTAVPLPR